MSARARSFLPRPSPGVALAVLALIVALTGTATAAGVLVTSKQIKDGTIQTVDISKSAQAQLRRAGSNGNSIEGAWKLAVTRAGVTPPTFQGYVTFAAGGSLVEVNPLNQSAGVGVWTKLPNHQYRWTFSRFRFSPAGVLTGSVTVVETDTLSWTATPSTEHRRWRSATRTAAWSRMRPPPATESGSTRRCPHSRTRRELCYADLHSCA